MIGFLRGTILSKTPHIVLVDVGGVGYSVEIATATSLAMEAEGAAISLFIHTHVREDSIRLFGFLSRFDQSLFEQLLSVSSIGPKMALALMSPLAGDELAETIMQGDLKTLTAIPGVGAKTAERIVLELKSKIQKLFATTGHSVGQIRPGASTSAASVRLTQAQVIDDARSALENLGYKDKQISDALGEFSDQIKNGGGHELSIEFVLKDALKKLSGRVLNS